MNTWNQRWVGSCFRPRVLAGIESLVLDPLLLDPKPTSNPPLRLLRCSTYLGGIEPKLLEGVPSKVMSNYKTKQLS